MKRLSWRVTLGLVLVAVTVVLVAINLLVFDSAEETGFWMLHSLAMLPIEVLLTVLILNVLLERRARQELLGKLNMVIGAFFSEVGADLLRRISAFDADMACRKDFLVKGNWDARRFAGARQVAREYDYAVDATLGDLADLRAFLVSKREFLLGLLENQSLLEHESFTDALWAVFHLAEELQLRPDVSDLPRSDLAHLASDMKRAYAALAVEWLGYVEHLKTAYPYLYSLAVRTNPLDPDACAVIPSGDS